MRLTLLAATAAVLLPVGLARAQTAEPAAAAGPGRTICETASVCELGIGDPVALKYEVNVEALPEADRQRLAAQCKAGGGTPCVVTFEGTEMGDPIRIKAAKMKWYN